MGSWLVESLCLDYEVGVFDTDRSKMKYFFNSRKFLYYEEILDFTPDLLINAVSLDQTLPVFNEIISYLPTDLLIDHNTKTATIRQGAAKTVGSLICQRRKKLAHQVPSAKNLDTVKKAFFATQRSVAKSFNYTRNVIFVHFFWKVAIHDLAHT